MHTIEATWDEQTVDQLRNDAAGFEAAVLRLRDGIQGAQHLPNGGVYVTDIAGAARTVIYNLGRIGNTLDKAAMSIDARADQAYLDYLGEQTDTSAEVTELADQLFGLARVLMDVHDRYYDLISKLGSIGQR